MRHNLDHAEAGGTFDAAYLADLSDDAVPALLSGTHRLSPEAAAEVLALVCTKDRRQSRSAGGLWAYNGGRNAAVEARNRACPG
ncbi:MAG: hypothetical protein ACRD1K_08060 [Acidimicrobiales bacterium]